MSKFDPVDLAILWSRLRFVTDEADMTLLKTAYSTVVRDAHDFTAAVFDEQGRLLAQATHTTPGLLGGMVSAVRRLADERGAEMRDGDTWITNDPWIVAGHTPDILMATPIFESKRLVGYSCSVVHHLDIGGRIGCQGRTVFEEGLRIPFLRLYLDGIVRDDVLELILNQVREPDKVRGDLRAQYVANQRQKKGVLELIRQNGLEDLRALGAEIIQRTEAGLRQAIRALPDGQYQNELALERPDTKETLWLRTKVNVNGEEIEVDFGGSSLQIPFGINCTLNFTRAYALYALKCVLDPHGPNNQGSVGPITVKAPEGSILNASFPASVMGRTSVGHFIPDLIFGAIAQAIPDKVVAENGSAPSWWQTFEGTGFSGEHFTFDPLFNGGQGARFDKDGLSTVAFPTNIGNSPVELMEYDYPLRCTLKGLIPDSGGAGKYRGGLGQVIEFEIPGGPTGLAEPVVLATIAGRHFHAAKGLAGGHTGRAGRIVVKGEDVPWGGEVALAPGSTVRFELPGGGGYGNPHDRDTSAVVRDVSNGLVTLHAAHTQYGVVFDQSTGRVDVNQTNIERGGGNVRSKA